MTASEVVPLECVNHKESYDGITMKEVLTFNRPVTLDEVHAWLEEHHWLGFPPSAYCGTVHIAFNPCVAQYRHLMSCE